MWDGNSNYHALVAKLTQQYRNGLSFNVSYTFAHTIDNVGGVTDQLNFRTARGDSQFDIRHRLVLNYQARFDGLDSLTIVKQLLAQLTETGLRLPKDVEVVA